MTNDPDQGPVWLEDQKGQRFPIRGSCSIGRSPSNQVALVSDQVSRRHALIQLQGENEFWLVDFGSRNGTYLNARRITDPRRLQHGDRVTIGPFEFLFLHSQSTQRGTAETSVADKTVTYIREAKCWLLVADIIGSTRLVKELPPDEVPVITGRWLAECKQTIEEHGGSINQFFGDGFFAYWRDHERAPIAVAATLQALRRLQEQARPGFRVVAHYGEAVIGGLSLGEEERISGREVHFAFRMEKLAGKLGEPRLLSQPAWERLAALVEARAIGDHALPGFDAKVPMYAI
jgi:adenylate cyclase